MKEVAPKFKFWILKLVLITYGNGLTLVGRWIRNVGDGNGKEDGQFAKPRGVTVDHDGNIIVADCKSQTSSPP